MKLSVLDMELTVCKVKDVGSLDLTRDFYFIAKTKDELSLVCNTRDVPKHTLAREDGWQGFKIEGVLDFSLVGILSRLTAVLAEKGIGVFAVSTYNTDYVLVKRENFSKAVTALESAGYVFG